MSFLSIFMSLVNSISLIQVLGTSYDRNYIYILGASINLLAGINGIYFVTLLYVIMFENFGDKKKWISGILSMYSFVMISFFPMDFTTFYDLFFKRAYVSLKLL